MRKIKLKTVGTFLGQNEKNGLLAKVLSKRYEVIFVDDNPDWLITWVYGKNPYEIISYDCPRILFSGENLFPDFNVLDYAISQYKFQLDDRHFHYPLCLINRQIDKHGDYIDTAVNRNILPTDFSILEQKDTFCNFIYSKVSDGGIRESFFEQLGRYKHIVSAGRHLNNMPDGKPLPGSHSGMEKIEFQQKSKFTIAFENTRFGGYCTEKISDAFIANTIPIYYGDPYVKEIFNPDAFIDVSDYKSFGEVIEVIRHLDNDDDAYMKMLSSPMYKDPELPGRRLKEYCEFLYNIFDQEPEQAFRRSRYNYAMQHNDKLNTFNDIELIKSKRISRISYRLLNIYAESGFRGVAKEICAVLKRRLF